MPSAIAYLRPVLPAVWFSLLWASGLPALAEPSFALDRISVAAGGFAVRPDIRLGVDTQFGSANSGELAAHRVTIPRLRANFLLGDSQGFAFDYYGFHRRYSDSLNRSFPTGTGSVTLNGNANANVGLDIGTASYKWWFGHEANVIGLGVGAAYFRVRLGANIVGATNINNALGSSTASYQGEAAAPLIQLGWRHAFDPNIRLYVDTSGVRKDYGDLNGHIYTAALGGEWYLRRNIGIGAEYGVARVQIDDVRNNANLNLRLDGPSLFLKARF